MSARGPPPSASAFSVPFRRRWPSDSARLTRWVGGRQASAVRHAYFESDFAHNVGALRWADVCVRRIADAHRRVPEGRPSAARCLARVDGLPAHLHRHPMCQVVRLGRPSPLGEVYPVRHDAARMVWVRYAQLRCDDGQHVREHALHARALSDRRTGAGVSQSPRGLGSAPALCAEPNQCAEHDGQRARAAC
jgi:hypothetical protein